MQQFNINSKTISETEQERSGKARRMNGLQLESNDKTEQIKHRQSVEYLSGILGMPRERIIAVYEQELNQMGRMVQVRDYLPILVSRRVKNLLQRG